MKAAPRRAVAGAVSGDSAPRRRPARGSVSSFLQPCQSRSRPLTVLASDGAANMRGGHNDPSTWQPVTATVAHRDRAQDSWAAAPKGRQHRDGLDECNGVWRPVRLPGPHLASVAGGPSSICRRSRNQQQIINKNHPHTFAPTPRQLNSQVPGFVCATQPRQPRVSEAALRRQAVVTGTVTAALHWGASVTAAAALPLPRPAAGEAT